MEVLCDSRSCLKYFLLGFITFGIYPLVLRSKLAHEINLTAEPDGKNTYGFWMWLLLSIITAGIYDMFWWAFICERMSNASKCYNVECKVNATVYIIFVIILCFTIVCPIIFYVRFFKAFNNINKEYNRINDEAVLQLKNMKMNNYRSEEIKDEIIDI